MGTKITKMDDSVFIFRTINKKIIPRSFGRSTILKKKETFICCCTLSNQVPLCINKIVGT